MTVCCVGISSSPVANPSIKYFRQAPFVATTPFYAIFTTGIAF
jgi:hypothetical protein